MVNRILEPSVTTSQALIVTRCLDTIGYMLEDNPEKHAFSLRFNELCDEAGIPPKGKNRQSIVGDLFGISQKGARKWLEGESIPAYEKLLEICDKWDVNIEWLYRGVGKKRVGYGAKPHTPEEQLLKIMEDLSEADKYRLIKIGSAFTESDSNGNGKPGGKTNNQ